MLCTIPNLWSHSISWCQKSAGLGINNWQSALPYWYTGCGKITQPPKKTYVSREWYNLNYVNLQHLLLRDIDWDSENFIHIFNQKQKLKLSKLKSAILQLKIRYYSNCCTKNANKINYMEFIWKDECFLNSSDFVPLDYHVWDAML